MATNESTPKQAIYKKWWVWVIAIVVIALIANAGKKSDATAPAATQTQAAPAPAESVERISLANFKKVYNGMTRHDVEQLLGPGEITSEAGDGRYRVVMMSWKAANGIANMNVMFQGGTVQSKAQLGLE